MSKESRIPFADIARRITGITTPVFGVNWEPPESKRDVVRRLVAFLEDRRALYAPYDMEHGPWVERSVLEMRGELTNVLKDCPEDENITGPIRAMRAACRKFLDKTGPPGRRERRQHFMRYEAGIWEALGELRAIFGLHLARLCAAYGVDAEPDLASIFPEPDEETEGEEKMP